MIASCFLTLYHLIFGFSKSKILFWISFLVMFIILGFRALTVGTDTVVYANMFADYQSGLFFDIVEPAWMFLNIGVDYLGGDFYTVLWISALFSLFPVFYGLNKFSPYPLFSVFIYVSFYFYFYSFNIMRQSVAQSFLFLSFCYLNINKDGFKQTKKFYIFFIIAFLFHYTSIVYLFFMAILFFVKNNNYRTYFMLAIAFVLGIGFNSLILKGATFFLTSYDGEQVSEDFVSGIINLAILNLAFIFISNFIKNKNKWYYGFFLFIIVSNIMNGISIGNRIVMFAGIFLIIFFSDLFGNLRLDKKWNLILFLFVVCYSYFRFFRLFGSGEILPYENTLINLKIIE